MTEAPKKPNIGKIILITLAAIIAVVCIAIAWFSYHYKGIIRKNLPSWVANASDSLYKVSVQDVSINLFTRKVTITNAKMWPDSTRLRQLKAEGRMPASSFVLSVPIVQANGISLMALLDDKELGCDRFYISQPVITITSLPVDSNTSNKEKKRSNIQRLKSNFIEIYQPTITYQNHATADSASYNIRGGSIVLNDWLFDPGADDFTEKRMYGKLDNVEIDSIVYVSSKGLYSMGFGHISIKGKSQQTTITNFRLKSKYDRQTFYKVVGHQKEIYSIAFPSVILKGFEPEQLINNNTLAINAIEIKDPAIDLYYSRAQPANTASKIGNYPNQIVQKFGVKTNVKTLAVKNGHFSYTELNPKTSREGKFHINSINGTAKNITNIAELLQQDHNTVINLNGKFMDASNMRATFTLDMQDTLGSFAVEGEHTGLKAPQVREMVKALALVDLKELNASKIKFKVQGNQNVASGSMTMYYTDLDVTLLKATDDKELKGMGFISFLADAALIHDHNPMPGKEVRSVSMYQKRIPTSSFFNLIWKTLFEGIAETAMKTEGAAELVQKGNAPDKPKVGIFKKIKQLFKKKEK